MQPSHCLIIFLTISVALSPIVQATGIHYHAKMLGKSVGRVAKAGLALHMLAAKKALLIGVPLAAAKGTFIAGTAGAGAMLGAPIGAIAGAKVGAAVGAIKGAAVGKALIVAKKALALKALAVGGALIAKPIILGAGIKAALLAKKVHLVGAGMSIVGKGMMLKGRALTAKGAKIAAVAGKIKAVTTAMKAKIAGAFVVPAIPVIPAVTHKKTKVYVGPQFANLAWNVAHPVTGFRYGTASVGGIRKKRDSETARSESPERPMNELITIVQSRSAQQCLAKVICELSADPNFHGDEGVKFAGTLMALGRANLPRSEHFRSASVTGSRSRNPVLCSHSFSDCGTPSTEVIKIGNALITG